MSSDAVTRAFVARRDAAANSQTFRIPPSNLRRAAQLASSFRLESWSFRSTEEACVSTVLTEIERRRAISLYA